MLCFHARMGATGHPRPHREESTNVKRIRIAIGTLLAVGAAVVGVSLGVIAPNVSGLGSHATHSQTHVIQADTGWNQTAFIDR
jgi:hypothetical protein